ncbi:uncharacterized protein LOC110849542 [Folsomia candida]|uniref:Uncharacterized protein n=1 Tax=Folsomia candida TaxID=158441 RepID=A0A226EHW8_FOLCA|nr:uncharacterized protein LOC110849542 [Folsomia candida]OXA56186.1 hypothetical protein Fcan01_09636 [Folsomia candida]
MRSKSLPIIQILFLACHCSVRFTSAKVAGFGKPSGGVKTPLEESDKGMPLTHPAVMIPLIGVLIMVMVFIVACCLKLFSTGETPSKPAQPRLQLGRKNRSRSRTPQPEFVGMSNAKDLPYDCYMPAAEQNTTNKMDILINKEALV